MKKHTLIIDEAFMPGLETNFGVSLMWIEVDANGQVERELGFNRAGAIVHRFPGNGRFGLYGIFDMNKFDTSSLQEDDIDPEEFEGVWRRESTV